MRAALLLLLGTTACAYTHQEVATETPVVGWGLGVSTNGPPEPWRLHVGPRIAEGGGRLSIPVGTAPGSITPTVGDRPDTLDYTSGQIEEDQRAVVGNFTPPLVLLPPGEVTSSTVTPTIAEPGELPPANSITVQTPLPTATINPTIGTNGTLASPNQPIGTPGTPVVPAPVPVGTPVTPTTPTNTPVVPAPVPVGTPVTPIAPTNTPVVPAPTPVGTPVTPTGAP